MLKRFFCLIFITAAALFYSCAKAPDKADLNEIVSEINAEKMEKCGDGIKDEWEECDFEGMRSCSEMDSKYAGSMKCEKCIINTYNCEEIDECSKKRCSGKGTCSDSIFNDFIIFCKCNNNSAGEDCSECKEGYHFDFDKECLIDTVCTKNGCNGTNQECDIVNGRAVCQCIYPWAGKNCDECDSSYYIDNGICKSKFCSSFYISCTSYQKCDDSSGKPKCVCKTERQDPDNCSSCLKEYKWDDKREFCINEKKVKCIHNPEAPVNSTDKTSSSTIYYTNENGWTDPEYCEWECEEGYLLHSNVCLPIFITKFNNGDVGSPVAYGFNEEGNLVAAELKKIYSFSKTQKTFMTEYNRSINEGIVGNDHNIYLIHDYGYSVFFKSTGKTLYFQGNNNYEHKNFSLIPDSIIFGNSYLDFPKLEYINSDNYGYSAETVVDKDENMLTAYENGTVKFNDKNWNLIWEKKFDNYLFNGHPALDKSGHAYLPYKSNLTNVPPGILTIDLSDGDPSSNQISLSFSGNSLDIPAVSIRNSSRKYIVYDGQLLVLDQNNSIVVNKKFTNVYSQYASVSFPPILIDDGTIYVFFENIVFCLNGLGETIWSRETEFPIRQMLHNNGILYVIDPSGVSLYSAPGNLSGDWPHLRHDPRLSNSMISNEFVDPPTAPLIMSPVDGTVFDIKSITFSWETDPGDFGIKHTLVLKNKTLSETFLVESEAGLNSANVVDLKTGNYEWYIVSKDENGSLNVSEARTLTIQ